MTKVAVQIKSTNPDRSPYKRYSTTYEPSLTFVEIDIPDGDIIQEKAQAKDNTEMLISLLTPAGAVALITALSEIGEEVDKHFQTKLDKEN